MICSHCKRDEQELELALKERGTVDTGAREVTGDSTASPLPVNTPEKLKGVGPKQAQPKVASVKAQVRDEQTPAATTLGRERTETSPIGIIRPVLGTSVPPLGGGRDNASHGQRGRIG